MARRVLSVVASAIALLCTPLSAPAQAPWSSPNQPPIATRIAADTASLRAIAPVLGETYARFQNLLDTAPADAFDLVYDKAKTEADGGRFVFLYAGRRSLFGEPTSPSFELAGVGCSGRGPDRATLLPGGSEKLLPSVAYAEPSTLFFVEVWNRAMAAAPRSIISDNCAPRPPPVPVSPDAYDGSRYTPAWTRPPPHSEGLAHGVSELLNGETQAIVVALKRDPPARDLANAMLCYAFKRRLWDLTTALRPHVGNTAPPCLGSGGDHMEEALREFPSVEDVKRAADLRLQPSAPRTWPRLLMFAAQAHDPAKLNWVLQNASGLKPRDYTMALVEASHAFRPDGDGGVAVAQTLLRLGADIDGKSGGYIGIARSPLCWAAFGGSNLKLISFLLASGANVNEVSGENLTALHCAARYGRVEAARLLLAGGADVNAAPPYEVTPPVEMVARPRGAPALAPRKLPGKSPLQMAIGDENSERELLLAMVQLLLDAGASPNGAAGVTPPLVHAANKRRTDIVQMLLARGADPNLPCYCNSVFGWGWYPDEPPEPDYSVIDAVAMHYTRSDTTISSEGVYDMLPGQILALMRAAGGRVSVSLATLNASLAAAAGNWDVPWIKQALALGADPNGPATGETGIARAFSNFNADNDSFWQVPARSAAIDARDSLLLLEYRRTTRPVPDAPYVPPTLVEALDTLTAAGATPSADQRKKYDAAKAATQRLAVIGPRNKESERAQLTAAERNPAVLALARLRMQSAQPPAPR